MNRNEILAELRSIAEQLSNGEGDLVTLQERSAELMQQLAAMDAAQDAAETRAAVADEVRRAVEAGEARELEGAAPVVSNRTNIDTKESNMHNDAKYRAAFVHYLQRRATDAELAVLRDGEGAGAGDSDTPAAADTATFAGWTTGADSAGPLVPSVLVNRIIEVAKQHAPLLSMINLVQVPGGVKLTVAGEVAAAAAHAEGDVITPATDTYTQVTLGAHEVAKLIEISDSAKRMTVPAFEAWLVDNLGKAVGTFIEGVILGGTGEGQATGILTGITWTSDNSVTVGAAASLTTANVNTLIGMLPGAFDANAAFIMSKKTFYTDFANLQDNAKHDLVRFEGKTAYIQGYPVVMDERLALHVAILGDVAAGYVGNMPEAVNIHSDYDITRNVYQYSGVAMFDGKPAVPSAFVKLAKASA